MSLFGSFMGADDDIFNVFGSPMHTIHRMNSMMNSMFSDPFDMMGQNALMPHHGRGLHTSHNMPLTLFDPHFGRFGFNGMPTHSNSHSFMSQSVMTMSSGPDGRPQVYQETMSTRMAPGGVKETKKTMSDSRTGTRKMAIGHHIGDRAHILERERNMHGDEEEHQEFINLDEEEADNFNREWETRTRRPIANAIEGANSAAAVSRHRPEPRQLALPSTTDLPTSRHSNRSARWLPSPRRTIRSLNSSKVKNVSPSSRLKSPESATSSRAEVPQTSSSTSGSRKREHKPDKQFNQENILSTSVLSNTNQTTVVEDEPTDNLYLALIQCFGIILCGYIAGRFGMITKTEANGLNTFVGTFALPSLIFMSLAKLDFTLVNWKFLLAVLLAKSGVFITVLAISLVIKKPSNPGRAALFAIFTTQSNDFAIGYPMIAALYGRTHPEYAAYLYLMAPISLAILNPIGFVLLEIGKRRVEEHTNLKNMIYSIVKGIVLNPILFMTVLGIIGNLIFHHNIPHSLAAILEVLGNAFSASALFLLGLMMVGKIHKLKGTALVIPGILISVKLLVLPLVIRESIILINAGDNTTETSDLSTYGFLYGTIPTAPALFIFTLRYNLEIDLIASAMVACTFISAPLMFVSAKLIDAVRTGITPINYARQLNIFSFDISVASAAASIWLMICFLGFGWKRYNQVTHRCTLCLIIAQLATAIGVIIWAKFEINGQTTLWYIQFILITTGVYASRIWTAAIAATVLFLSSRSLPFVENVQKWFYPFGWGVPLLMVSLICATVKLNMSTLDIKNPNFQLGRTQAAVSSFVLIFCFIVTLGCLILHQRYQRRHSVMSYEHLRNNNIINSIAENRERNIVDVEDLVSPLISSPQLIGCEFQNGCPSEACRADEERSNCNEENETNADNDPQILRHVVFLILLSCSMFIGLSISVGTLIMEELTGIYAELAFLDAALNFGQSLIAFAIFGLDPSLGKLGYWLRKICRIWQSGKELQLPREEALSPEARAIRDQFNRCHLNACRTRISMCRRRLLRVYRGVFSGTDLVNWLLDAGIVNNREDAVRYGRCLLESRVLQHIDGTQHFYDQNLLYTFNA